MLVSSGGVGYNPITTTTIYCCPTPAYGRPFFSWVPALWLVHSQETKLGHSLTLMARHRPRRTAGRPCTLCTDRMFVRKLHPAEGQPSRVKWFPRKSHLKILRFNPFFGTSCTILVQHINDKATKTNKCFSDSQTPKEVKYILAFLLH